MKALYRFFNSIRLTLVLTYVVVVLTIAGSFTLLTKKQAFGNIDAGLLIDWLRRSDLSASWWIISLIALIALFAINTVVCTIDRLAALLKAGRGQKAPDEEESLATEDIRAGRRVRFRTLLPYIAHIGFLIALAGHLTGSLFGFRGEDMVARAGERVNGGETGLAIEVTGMDMVLSKRGYPESMWGEVTLIENGEALGSKRVEINRPLLQGSTAVYIKNVMTVPDALVIGIAGPEGGRKAQLRPGLTEEIVPQHLSITGGRMNEQYGAMEVILLQDGAVAARQWLTPYNPQYRTLNFGAFRITAEELTEGKAGVFVVNRDPGVWIVFTGLTIFAGALIPHLFLRRQGRGA